MYSEFQEITLPALRFEKVEETDTKKWKKWIRYTEEKRRSNDARRSQETQRENDVKTTPKEKQNHSQENDTQRSFKTESICHKKEIKLTHRKNGH